MRWNINSEGEKASVVLPIEDENKSRLEFHSILHIFL